MARVRGRSPRLSANERKGQVRILNATHVGPIKILVVKKIWQKARSPPVVLADGARLVVETANKPTATTSRFARMATRCTTPKTACRIHAKRA